MRTNRAACALLAFLAAGAYASGALAQRQGTAGPAQLCTGGRASAVGGLCVCPSDKPVWTGIACERDGPPACTGGRERNLSGYCICPPARPRWNGKTCR